MKDLIEKLITETQKEVEFLENEVKVLKERQASTRQVDFMNVATDIFRAETKLILNKGFLAKLKAILQ